MQRKSKKTNPGGRTGRRRSTADWHPRYVATSAKPMARLLRRQASWSWAPLCFVLVFCFPAGAARADADVIVSPDQLQSGGLLFRMQNGYAIATRLNTDIEIRANGLVARTALKQTFRNDGHTWVEGIYVFPLPDNAAVDRMKLHIGERFIEGEIREKERAKKEYEQAKEAGKKASLVRQQRANLFTTAVANIAPGETVAVEIEYQQMLSYDEGTFSLRFPLTMTPRYIPGVPANDPSNDRKGSGWSADTDQVADASLITPPVVTASDDHKVTMRATIDAGMPLEFVASRYHTVNVNANDALYEVTLADGDVPMDHDLELVWRPIPASAPQALVFSEQHGKQTHLLVMLVPPADAETPVVVVPRELIFIIDTSGSMHGTSIEQARKSLLLALDGLRPSDRFNVIQFNSVTEMLFTAAVDASVTNVQHAKNYVLRLQANGGTEMRPALQKALHATVDDRYLRQIIFITDGSVGNEEALFRLIENDLGDTRLFTVGIGSAPNGWFMQQAAASGRGTYTFISAQHEVNEKMDRLFRKLEQPRVTDIDVRWPRGAVVDAYPDRVPDLYSGEPVVIKARLQRPPEDGEEVVISGIAALRQWDAYVSLATASDSAGIAALWARARIEDLDIQRRRGADPDEIRAAMTSTAISYRLVSKHTSLVAVDKTPVRPASEALDMQQVPSLLPHGQSLQAIMGFAATATAAPMHRLTGAICLLLALLLALSGRRRVRGVRA